MTVKLVNYDKNYPILITDAWGGKVCATLEEAKEILKDLKKVVKTLEETIDKQSKVWYNKYRKNEREK